MPRYLHPRICSRLTLNLYPTLRAQQLPTSRTPSKNAPSFSRCLSVRLPLRMPASSVHASSWHLRPVERSVREGVMVAE